MLRSVSGLFGTDGPLVPACEVLGCGTRSGRAADRSGVGAGGAVRSLLEPGRPNAS
ncbi:hypothetical protein [Streptomyces adonidis]|uniref:Uncharacterized protein n=1 Tax=Streptomyces sp. NBC_00093 TaxID=2975649 RepID=A0AAU2A3C2_9ACTN